MWIEGLLEEMRRQLRAALPEQAFIRRDRGDALFITNAPAFDAHPAPIPLFLLENQGGLLYILPNESWIAHLEENAPVDHLSASLLRFKGQIPDRENLKLFARGLKILDAASAAAGAEISAFDRCLRQRCALALRGGCGGALYACALLNAKIHTLYKGETQP